MTPERMADLVARWVRRYTRHVPSPIAERRIDEIDADLHDHIAHERAEGRPDRRIALPNASVMVHQPSGGYQGQASDIARHAENIQKTKRRLIELYARHCGQSEDEVERALDRDNFMSAEEARAWGLVDHVYERRDAA